MMHLFIKEHNNNHQRMTVRDERGQILYIIEGRWGRKNDVTSIYRINGERLLSAKQVKDGPLSVFEILQDGEEVGSMRKHPGLFGIRDSYFSIHPVNWMVTGDFEDLYFTVHDNQHLIMECEKDIYDQYAIYELVVDDEEHAPFCALISTLFDHYSRSKDEEKSYEEIVNSDYDLGFSHYSFIYPLRTLLQDSPDIKIKTR